MKNIKFIKTSLSVLLLSITIVSCNDFLDVNENPNNPSISTPSLTLPVAQNNLAIINGRNMTYLGNFIAYNWATPSNWSANENFMRYNITTNFYDEIFEFSYGTIFRDLTYIDNYEDASGAVDYSAYKVISKILKGFQYQYLVDLYGDVPFTEANQRGANRTPKYDDAEMVYKANIDSLTAAVNLAMNLPENAEDPGTQDIVFGGDMNKWAQFANSIKLRMLVRMSNTGQDTYINDQIALIDANGAGYITSNVSANPGYSDNEDKQSPFYGYFREPSTGLETDRSDYTVASDYALNYLNSTGDPRLERIYSEARNGGYKGVEQSTTLPGSGFTSNDLSKVGPGLLKSPDQDQVIMLLAESLFVRAEAAQRGYTTEDPEALYNAAIEESFIYLGVGADDNASVAAAQAYYAQMQNNINWNASSNKIEAIITQKWIALNGTSSIEVWIENTRTGYPVGLPVPDESDGIRPVTLLYPASEVARNSENVPTQTKADAFTQNPFWK